MKSKVIMGVMLTLLLIGMITPAYAEEYVFILKWGSRGTGDGQFKYASGVAVDGSGNVYVADYGNDRVQKFGVSTPVGGIYIPVNKLELLAPYIGLTTLLAVAVMTVGYVKKRKRDTEVNS